MSIESIVLLSNLSNDSKPTEWQFSTKQKGAGHHKYGNGLHTAVFQFDYFKGSVKLQGTLALYPTEADWIDVDLVNPITNLVDSLDAVDSTPLVETATRNFTGRYVWIRSAVMLEQGTITQIRFNY
jgi:hypothetical protein